MSFMGSLIDGIDNGVLWLSSILKTEIGDYCDLETAQDEHTLVAKDGSLLSVISIDGVKSLIGGKNFYNNIVIPVDGALSQSLNKAMHSVQISFLQDPSRTVREIEHHLAPARETAKNLSLDLDDMLNERVKNIASWTNFEAGYMVLWTRPKGLTKAETDTQKKKNIKRNENAPQRNSRGQDPNRAYSVLIDRHASFVNSLHAELTSTGISCEVLNVIEACREIRNSIDPKWTSPSWKPVLPGDPITPQMRKNFLEAEEWDVIWPKLGPQLAPRDAKVVGDNLVQVGDTVYAPVYIDLFARDPKPFWDLYGRLMNSNLPWRMSFLIDGDGFSGMTWKKTGASLLGWAPGGGSDNKLIKQSIEKLDHLKQNAETIVKVRASFCTWGDANNVDEVQRQVSDLARGIENWGGCEVSEKTGDPVAGLASCALGFTYGNIGTPAIAPLKEIVAMMPLTRPSSPWKTGAVTFRSPDGKLLPYQPGSREQVTWISLIFAKPGSGKSVLMNMTNLALCLAPGIARLPRIAIVDIGPSSSGLISLLKEALPADQKELVAYHRIRMTREYSINPFDTQPGCRFPSSLERQFLINFVTLLVTDVNSEAPPTGMAGLVTAIIEDMYRKCADKGTPHKYTPGQFGHLDDKLNQLRMDIDRNTSWWEVVDFLNKHGEHRLALEAQRQAVPVLSEATFSAMDEKLKVNYEEVKVETSETLIRSFCRMISDALKSYPILARPTAFELGDARVISLDLDEVAKTGGAVADRQTAVMYMLARYVLAKDFYVNEESVSEVPYPTGEECPEEVPVRLYREMYLKKAEETKEDYKRICFDEFHRTSKSRAVRDQVLVDMREGRKWGVDVTLSSQALEDFDPQMLEFATAIFVMDGGNAQSIEKISNVFGFEDPAEKAALQHQVHGPRRGGGTFMAKFNTKKGWYTMLLTSTLGPIELWALNTTAQDALLRKKLYNKIGPKRARLILSIKFPGGSAVEEIDNRKLNLRKQGLAVDADGSNIIEDLANELADFSKQLESRGR